MGGRVSVKTFFSLLTPAGKGGFGAKGGEYLSHLDSNVAGTNHQHRLRLLLQVKETVAGDPEFGAGERGEGPQCVSSFM